MITKCEKCAFAVSNNGIQTGCTFNVPESITHNHPDIYGKNLIEVVNGYFRLKNFYCPYARTKDWYTEIQNRGGDPIQVTSEETRIKYNLVCLAETEDMDNLFSNLSMCLESDYPPSYISFITRQVPQKHIDSIMAYMKNRDGACKWKISNILDNDMTHSETIDLALENNLLEHIYNLLVVVNSKYLVQPHFFEAANDIVNSFINQQAVILPKNPLTFHGIVLPISLYVAMNNKIGIALDYLEHTNDTYKFCLEHE